MNRLRAAALAALAALGLLQAGGAGAEPLIDRCTAQVCKARLTPDQLVNEVQALVVAGRYDDARPMVAAMAAAPALKLQYRFLSGYIAAKSNDLETAARFYREILTEDPSQTRVRLELASVLMMQGKPQSADRQLRIAEDDHELPPEIARTIRGARDVIRSRRAWSLNVDAGLVPDSNINNATSSDTINVYLGGQALPLSVDESAKPRSGLGKTASIDAGLRLPIAKDMLLLVDADAVGTDYKGNTFDDYAYEAAVGPELRLSDTRRVRVQAVAAQRDYGHQVATRQVGLKGGYEARVGARSQLGLQIDARRTFAKFDRSFSGWQVGAYATLERAVTKGMIASTGGFVRRDALRAGAFSNVEVGAIAGLGGELPHGLNFAVSGSASRALYDKPLGFFSPEPRRDWRYGARVTLGTRKLRVAGLSPSVSWSISRIDSTLGYYANTRSRFRFALARYF